MNLLLSIRDRLGTTLLIATHDPTVASRCDRIVRLADGRIIDQAGDPGRAGGAP